MLTAASTEVMSHAPAGASCENSLAARRREVASFQHLGSVKFPHLGALTIGENQIPVMGMLLAGYVSSCTEPNWTELLNNAPVAVSEQFQAYNQSSKASSHREAKFRLGVLLGVQAPADDSLYASRIDATHTTELLAQSGEDLSAIRSAWHKNRANRAEIMTRVLGSFLAVNPDMKKFELRPEKTINAGTAHCRGEWNGHFMV